MPKPDVIPSRMRRVAEAAAMGYVVTGETALGNQWWTACKRAGRPYLRVEWRRGHRAARITVDLFPTHYDFTALGMHRLQELFVNELRREPRRGAGFVTAGPDAGSLSWCAAERVGLVLAAVQTLLQDPANLSDRRLKGGA